MTLTEKIIELVRPPTLGAATVFNQMKMEHARKAPITLADVLKAMNKINHPIISVWSDGSFAYIDGLRKIDGGEYAPTWNLSADLDGQSEETKEFISKILGV